MKKAFWILLSFNILQFACEKENYGSCDEKPFFNISGIELQAIGTIPQPNRMGSATILKDQDEVPFASFYLDGTLKANYYATNKASRISFFPMAVATPPCPMPGWQGSKEQLAGIYLITLGNYNADFQPGDTLTDILRINNQPALEYMEENKLKINNQQLTLRLSEKPNPNEYQSFRLIYKLTNGETYESTTPGFKLL